MDPILYEFALLFDVTDGNPVSKPEIQPIAGVEVSTGGGFVSAGELRSIASDYLDSIGYPAFDRSTEGWSRYYLNTSEGTKAFGRAIAESNFPGKLFGLRIEHLSKYKIPVMSGLVRFGHARTVDSVSCYSRPILTRRNGIEFTTKGTAVSYGLYVSFGSFSRAALEEHGLGEDEIVIAIQTLVNMFERTEATFRRLILWECEPTGGAIPRRHLDIRRLVETPKRFTDYELFLLPGEYRTLQL